MGRLGDSRFIVLGCLCLGSCFAFGIYYMDGDMEFYGCFWRNGVHTRILYMGTGYIIVVLWLGHICWALLLIAWFYICIVPMGYISNMRLIDLEIYDFVGRFGRSGCGLRGSCGITMGRLESRTW